MRQTKAISFEFFPPRDIAAQEKLVRTGKQLVAAKPEYVSVTFGAGGSTRSGTAAAVRVMQNLGFETAPHLSCVGSTKVELAQVLNDYRQQGVRRLVALRGDLPSGMGSDIGELHYASDLVRFVRDETGDWFHIDVAAYPEMHPESSSADTDLNYFIAKLDAGANSAITQFFFNADAYFDFMDRVRQKGVTVPIVPGIMPITNNSQLLRFAKMCGADIPRWIRLRLLEYGDDRESIRAFGVEVISRLCQTLLDNGAPGLHFYTLNNADITNRIMRNLSV